MITDAFEHYCPLEVIRAIKAEESETEFKAREALESLI